ncbi:MAG: hypothetical protein ACI9TH_003529 [Kiritimatiellia bacterium]|jgi:hypothetical protein
MKKSMFQASPVLVILAIAGLGFLAFLFWRASDDALTPSQQDQRDGLHVLVALLVPPETPVLTSSHFRIHGLAGAANEVMRRAEHAWYASNERGLRGFEPAGKGHIVLLNASEWAAFNGQTPQEPARRSGQIERTILLVREPGQPFERSDVAHEVIHYRLEGAGLPLWLEEGLALQLGVEITLAFEQLIGQRAAEDTDPAGERLAIDRTIMDFDRYPDDPDVLAGFYRHCRLFVAALNLNKEQLHVFVQALGQGAAWEEVLTGTLEQPPELIERLRIRAAITVRKE